MDHEIPIRELPLQSVLSLRPLCIGYQLEHMATRVRIDATPWLERWPGAELAVIAQRPGEDTSYPADITVQDGIIQWMITRYDTEKAGMGGNMLVIALLGGKEAASNTAPLSILERGSGPIHTDTPLPQPPWASAVVEIAQNAAGRAEEAAERAQEAWHFGPENAGMLLYIAADGTPVPLQLGSGLEIRDGALTITNAQAVRAICGQVLAGQAKCGEV